MYTIIGGDGREYGPVTADQVRSWIAGGRANLQTKIKVEGSAEWKSVADFPEITGAGTAAAPADTAAAALAQLPAVAGDLDVLSCYERSWNLLKANFWPLVGVSLVIGILSMALGYSVFIGIFYVQALLGALIAGGLQYYILRRVRGEPATFGDAFAGFTKAFVALLVAGILIDLFVTVGMICLILPGVYLLVAYSFTNLLAIDKGLGFWEAMEVSRRAITRRWWSVLGLLLLGIPIMLLGFIAFGVGIFIALPLVVGALVYAYEDLCNPKK
jgi:hypothetical protein